MTVTLQVIRDSFCYQRAWRKDDSDDGTLLEAGQESLMT